MSLTGRDEQALSSYLKVVFTFIEGTLRVLRSSAAHSRLMCALSEFHQSGQCDESNNDVPTFRHLANIPYRSFDALAYVTDVSLLVYATTLLDTFLSDTTLFLFLLFPEAIGNNQQVPLKTIIDATSRNDALTKAAVSRTREISYLPFLGRVQFLRDRFGLTIPMKQQDERSLEHYPSIRNTAVHDQGVYELRLDEQGRVSSRQKACPLHPTQLEFEDLMRAFETYENVAGLVAGAVLDHVLKQPAHPVLRMFRLEGDAATKGGDSNESGLNSAKEAATADE